MITIKELKSYTKVKSKRKPFGENIQNLEEEGNFDEPFWSYKTKGKSKYESPK